MYMFSWCSTYEPVERNFVHMCTLCVQLNDNKIATYLPRMMSQTFCGVYSSVPPADPRQSHLPLSSPMQRSTVARVRMCAVLNLRSCSVAGFASGVTRYSVRG